ncbi:MAG: hypothetical protein HY318_09945 [Armatimonadetes bacterium]|nr:hypothetical protein [Armatimonadota bacterium]
MATILHWEELVNEGDMDMREVFTGLRTCRTKVPGGWLVALVKCDRDYRHQRPSITFVADPEHSWEGGSLPGPQRARGDTRPGESGSSPGAETNQPPKASGKGVLRRASNWLSGDEGD